MGKRTFMTMAAVLAVALVACDREDPDDVIRFGDDEIERARAGWPEGMSARIDSGNMAYRAGDYDAAARHYRQATELDPDVGAAWFGLHMAEQARGDTAAAAAALRRAEAVTPGLGTGHPQGMPEDMPPGHPPMTPDG